MEQLFNIVISNGEKEMVYFHNLSRKKAMEACLYYNWEVRLPPDDEVWFMEIVPVDDDE